MNDLALTIFFARPKLGVILVVKAFHKNVFVLAEENGRRGVTFVSQRCGPLSEWGGADRATVRLSARCTQGNAL